MLKKPGTLVWFTGRIQSRSLGPAAWQRQIRKNPRGSTFTVGWLRAPSKGFIVFLYWPRKKLISQLIQFNLVFYYDPTQSLQNQLNHPSLMYPPGCTSYPIPPKLISLVFGWLSPFYLSFDGRLRPRRI